MRSWVAKVPLDVCWSSASSWPCVAPRLWLWECWCLDIDGWRQCLARIVRGWNWWRTNILRIWLDYNMVSGCDSFDQNGGKTTNCSMKAVIVPHPTSLCLFFISEIFCFKRPEICPPSSFCAPGLSPHSRGSEICGWTRRLTISIHGSWWSMASFPGAWQRPFLWCTFGNLAEMTGHWKGRFFETQRDVFEACL